MGRRVLRYPSSIERLPAEIRNIIGRLREQGRTLDEIMEKLRELDVEVSRSALGRFTRKQIDAIAAQSRSVLGLAEALNKRLDEGAENKVAKMNVQLLHGILANLLIGDGENPVTFEPKEAAFLGSLVLRLTQAEKIDAEREMKIRKETAARAAEAAKGAARKAGLSAEVIAAIERDVLGIVR